MDTQERIDPVRVPRRALRGGDTLPAIGLGTFGSDRYTGAEVATAVEGAIGVGYRLIDCAAVYGNEALVGDALRRAMAAGVRREELFLTSKVWNDRHGKGDVLLSCAQSLKDLGLEVLDLFLVHWPFPNFHPVGAPPDYHNPDAKPYLHERYLETWYQMEQLVRRGLVRHIGTSNMTIPKLEGLLRDCRIPPSANEMELHPCFQQPELFAYCTQRNILPIGYCPIGSPSRPERDRTADDVADTDDPVVVRIARAHGVHPAVVCLKWAVQRGQVPIPFATKAAQYTANLRAVTEDPLTGDEMAALAAVDRNCRLIKGQVFLWDGATDWHDLWDEDGTIAGMEERR